MTSMLTTIETQQPVASEHAAKLPPLSILRMLWKRRWLAFSVWVILSAVTFEIVHYLPAIYEAEAVIVIDSQKIPEAFVSPTVSGNIADRLAVINESIMTSARLLDTIRTFDLYPKERTGLAREELLRRMKDDITVNFDKSWTGDRTQAFRLCYRGYNPKIVAAVTNRLAGLYVEENIRTREDQAEGTVDFLKQHLQDAKQGLDEQEHRLAQFKEHHNGTLPEQQGSLLGTLSSLSVQLEGVQASIARVQENKLSLEAALSAAESSEATLRASLQHQSRAAATSTGDAGMVPAPKSEILEEQLRQLRLKYSPQHPDVQALQEQLAEARREEAEELKSFESAEAQRRKASPGSTEHPLVASPELLQITERIATLRAQITVANHQADSLDQEHRRLEAQISDCQARINQLPLVEQEMAALKRNYEESANNYNSLLQKQLAAGMATDMERSHKSERFTIIDAARVPEKPVKPNRPVLIAAGCVAGLAIGLAIAFLLEFRKNKFLGEWELPAGAVVLGRVPLIPIATVPAPPRA